MFDFPKQRPLDASIPHAPKRRHSLSASEVKRAVKNALRYFPKSVHHTLAKEFAEELKIYGHIYMYRFRPVHHPQAKPLSLYNAKCQSAAAVMFMIDNNLNPAVAQFPEELVTYGGNGTVFSNWYQYTLTMQYLQDMTDHQTLVLSSGHPLGLFPSSPDAPRVVITNGLVVPNHSTLKDYENFYALGVSQYGQMTAGSFCYIGSQGIVHGTTLTLLNAGRRYLASEGLSGKIFITSGLGGMSGAQPKAAKITGGICIVAEVNEAALKKRLAQGWLDEFTFSTDEIIRRAKYFKERSEPRSIGFLGNAVDLWEALAASDLHVDLGSDQTSLHNPYGGGYYPAGCTVDEANDLMTTRPEVFKEKVHESLKRQVAAVNVLALRGMRFWDYGNAFLLQAGRAGAEIFAENSIDFRYPSYFEDFMGDVFSLGFGPFRWICLSNDPLDLEISDEIAAEVQEQLLPLASVESQQHYRDNIKWIKEAKSNNLVVGSQARILYCDKNGRVSLALALNEAVKSGRLRAPVAVSRDHHDVSGTDSPYRETANIIDGSKFTADMSTLNFAGNAIRGATWVALHNGGGVGWGEVINGGFGLVLDGTAEAERKARAVLEWDVCSGVARRCWSENEHAKSAILRAMEENPLLRVTIPEFADESTFYFLE